MVILIATLVVVAFGLFVCLIPMARLNDTGVPAFEPEVALSLVSNIRHRQKVRFPTRAGKLLVAHVMDNDGNGGLKLRRPGHIHGFWRQKEEVIL